MQGPRRGITFGADCWSPEHPAAGTALHQRATGLALGVTSAAVQPATPLLSQPSPLHSIPAGQHPALPWH